MSENANEVQEISYDDAKQVATHYAKWASQYDKDTEAYGYVGPRSAAQALARHVDPASAGRILDIGCGTGLTGLALRELGYEHIDGADLSPEMLALATKKGVYDSISVEDLLSGLSHDTDSYDTAVSVGTFGPVGPKAFPQCLRVVKPGGILCVSVHDMFYEKKGFSTLFDRLVVEGKIDVLELGRQPHLLEGNHDAFVGVFRVK